MTKTDWEAARRFIESQPCPRCKKKGVQFRTASYHFEIPKAAYIDGICHNCLGGPDRLVYSFVLLSYLREKYAEEGDTNVLPTDATPAAGV